MILLLRNGNESVRNASNILKIWKDTNSRRRTYSSSNQARDPSLLAVAGYMIFLFFGLVRNHLGSGHGQPHLPTYYVEMFSGIKS